MNTPEDFADLINYLNQLDTKSVKTMLTDMCPCKTTRFLKYISETYIFSTRFEKQITSQEAAEIKNLLKKFVSDGEFDYESEWGTINQGAENVVKLQPNTERVLKIYNSPKFYYLHGKLEKSLRFAELCQFLNDSPTKYIMDLFDYACWFYPSNELCNKLLEIVSQNSKFPHHLAMLSKTERDNLDKMNSKHLVNKYGSRHIHNILTMSDLSEHSCYNILYIFNTIYCQKILESM